MKPLMDSREHYQLWKQCRDDFLRDRLRPALWIGIVIALTITLYFQGEAVLDPEQFKISNLWIGVAVECSLLTCLALHKTQIGYNYPAALFLGFSWSLTLIVQLGAALSGVAHPQIQIWSLAFLTQATLMPVQWRLHVIAQVGVIACYIGMNIILGLSIHNITPFKQTGLFLYVFWFCFICDLSVYWYERLQRHEFVARQALEAAYEKLEAAEAKYHSIFENAVEGIFQSTPEGYYLTANPALANIYGYDSPEELITELRDIEHQLYVDASRRAEFIRQMEKYDRVSEFVSQVYRKDGSIVWISENAIAVRSETGELLHYEGLIEDITERKEAEEALRVFIHAVSHDLRNPVTGMLMVLKALLQKQQDHTVTISESTLARMIQGSTRQLSLINSLLEAHANEVRGIVIHCQPTQLSELVQATIADLQPLLDENQAVMVNQVAANLPLVKVDPIQLWRVFSNLIANALKHNPPGLKMTVTATVEGEMICCSVEDNGIGIQPEQCKHLFDLYTRGSQAGQPLGLGLGLYLCRQIIQAHGGDVNVISVPGAGATFWFTLPLVELHSRGVQ